MTSSISRVLISITLTIFCSPTFAELSPLQLRVMQTRVFEKPPEEVLTALANLCMDKAMAVQFNAGLHFRQGGCVNPSPTIDSGFFGIKMPPGQTAQITYQLTPPGKAEDTKTTIRLRVTEWALDGYSPKMEPVTESEAYSRLFDFLGQYLFIEGIEWSPDLQG
jgi:hypothetical protein